MILTLFRRLLGATKETMLIVGSAVILLELALYFLPGLIPLAILADFHPDLRAVIAERRHLPALSDTILLERDDGGPPLRVYKPHAKIVYDFDDPGTVQAVQMDDTGFCNPPGEPLSRPEIEIITIGDSFTWCMTVRPEDTWTSELGRLTGERVYNLGVNDKGLYEELEILKQFGLPKSPRVVIMNVYEGNDLIDAERYHTWREAVRVSGGTAPTSQPCSLGALCRPYRWLKEGPLAERSYALNLAFGALRRGRDWLAASGTATGDGEGSTEPNYRYRVVFGEESILFNPANYDEARHAERLRRGDLSLDLFSEVLTEFVALSRVHRFVPVIVYTPLASTAYATNVAFDDPRLAELIPWYSQTLRGYFAARAQELGYRFFDLTPILQEAAEAGGASSLLYYPTNTHLTRDGHRVIAEAIFQALPR